MPPVAAKPAAAAKPAKAPKHMPMTAKGRPKMPVDPLKAKKLNKKQRKFNALPKMAQKWLKHRTTRPLWTKVKGQAKAKGVDPATLIRKPKQQLVKKIGGDKNGKTRVVVVKKARKYYPTEDRKVKSRAGNVCYRSHARKFKAGLEPGRIVIVLAGRHKGKHVVVLSTLPSGLLLVTGPHVVNGCPLRRMHQQFVIVTSTKLDLSSVKVPEKLNDGYFKRHRDNDKAAKKSKKGDGGDIFGKKQEAYKPSAERKADQIAIDKALIEVVKKNKDKKLLLSYLGSYFQIRNRVYPHKLKF